MISRLLVNAGPAFARASLRASGIRLAYTLPNDQRPHHTGLTVARHGAVDHVLARLVDLHVHHAAGGLSQREVNSGVLLRLLMEVLKPWTLNSNGSDHAVIS